MIELRGDLSRSFADGLLVRSARSEDLPELVSLLGQLHAEDAPPDMERLSATFAQMLATPARAVLVACVGEALVGTLDLEVVANLTHGGRPWAGIENVVVDAAYRRRGVGRALAEVAVELAREAGCYKLQLLSREDRQAAHALYEASGFDVRVRGFRRYLEP
jgi:ribosomal protein S18 acetylase RimI-like enzyme